MYPKDWSERDKHKFHHEFLDFPRPSKKVWLGDIMRAAWEPTNNNPAVIFDVDGTLCDVSSIRYHVMPGHPQFSGKKRFDRFHSESVDCPPNSNVLDLARVVMDLDLPIFIVTSRMEMWKYHTILWLVEYEVPYYDLLMRADNDTRPDYEVKREILQEIRKTHTPVLAVDDNPSVVELWEEEGILTLTVPGWEDE